RCPERNGPEETPMTTRRHFLTGAAASGIVFCSCGMLERAHAQTPHRGLPVTVNGRRVRTVHVPTHRQFREANGLIGDDAERVVPQVKGAKEHFIVVADRLKAMDDMGIDMQILSINPFWYRKDRETAEKIVTLQNEKLAELCAAHPDRFGAFASLTLQYPD